jgi:hypothetical protein
LFSICCDLFNEQTLALVRSLPLLLFAYNIFGSNALQISHVTQSSSPMSTAKCKAVYFQLHPSLAADKWDLMAEIFPWKHKVLFSSTEGEAWEFSWVILNSTWSFINVTQRCFPLRTNQQKLFKSRSSFQTPSIFKLILKVLYSSMDFWKF